MPTPTLVLNHEEAVALMDRIVNAPNTIPEAHTPGASAVAKKALALANHSETCLDCRRDPKVVQKLEAVYIILDRKVYPIGAIAFPSTSAV
ncbi:hypothetical protein A3B21_00935 [Candidatus Uhrbacteria bacterium RIFCSPLOWO2_01_FULL_47_24]|uniref:Uncharacterized protein n=1 Tax=Candidatus Uhrbacteria bacterium RIFCSPLOWO2_01_FULL_47_24 TaxID=1802401 RepID=A0A1F7UQH2_9BACT|nr:MAG: hypothetical protein A3D58_01100 [Candidatus Uhrbacteria bacterium RIFCSPHIGHO2_02_FULL_46_47]OGL76634.1 MAG: hypothetical protein A3F52_03620 [Candidatus Uhrbacteria bacterium RIFCSPHIGHO2_12_FULL_47_11]OGL79958.1 MAG: hypothetical protein A3B21_00935 [Candidatus Uhrbacteria bacterium RIFCSPLOWO2_01_FULL_47_24]OGL84338.1 MAG: hypothetical protein A3J03_00405 [Candidatus Uhrbacteria bacterium RIFCSPLOWO2_02_FULL_46_25]OGL91996.1 MAG: hypothetical protein A3H11_01550 [Candidatus Uhrbacte